VTDIWSARAQAMRESPTHREGPDLDLVVEWCEAGEGVQALDVATGGQHVARRLREAGASVVTVDPAPGMEPDVIARAEELPFGDGTFDVVACRIAAHHFDDVAAAVKEMARVSKDRVVVQDTLFQGDVMEEVEKIRDPTHVRRYSEEEWRGFVVDAELEIDRVEIMTRRLPVDAWLERADATAEIASRVKERIADMIEDGLVPHEAIILRGRT
jgi:SAM-dependent methyltransferase